MRIWNHGIELAVKAYQLTKKFPKEEMFGLKSQVNRAAVSVPSNIAEGCRRSGERDFARFREISLGSAYEVETQLVIAQQIGYLESDELNGFLQTLSSEQRQILSLINKLNPPGI